jgi:hypothetical protein
MNEESFVIGAESVIREFGRWPSFHDAQVISIVLQRAPVSMELKVNVFAYGPPTPESRPYFERLHDSVLTMLLTDIEDLELEDWNHQNVLNSIQMELQGDRVRVALSGIFGVTVSCTCDTVEVTEFRPAIREWSETKLSPELQPAPTPHPSLTPDLRPSAPDRRRGRRR